jgi:SAM-dependent methyltransferase
MRKFKNGFGDVKDPIRKTYSDSIWGILACPLCHRELKISENGVKCSGCLSEYTYSASGGLDFRLNKKKSCVLEFEIVSSPALPSELDFRPLSLKKDPEVNFSAVRVPFHLTKELLSYFPKARRPDSIMLDLGCGDTVHKEVSELAGFQYVGLDFQSIRASFLGDCHSLPFKNDSFEFILSVAVLEHIRFPHLMTKEAYRVLKPGGSFIGTVSFLEPFHGDSYYHHTHLGVYGSLSYAGFNIKAISPNPRWSGLRAQATMGLFPKMPHFAAMAFVWPLEIISRLWWKAGSLLGVEKSQVDHLCRNAGSFVFIAEKG